MEKDKSPSTKDGSFPKEEAEQNRGRMFGTMSRTGQSLDSVKQEWDVGCDYTIKREIG